MSEFDNYGLRAAKRIVRNQSAAMKGDKGDYARGYRAALRDIDRLLTAEISRNTRKGESSNGVDS